LQFENYVEAWDNFKRDLHRKLDQESAFVWTRFSEEVYDHKRVREVAVWRGEGSDEKGYVFMAKAHGAWDGKVDWARIMAIVEDERLALGHHEPSRVWDLGTLSTQTEAQHRCGQCGKLT
jgi:hypothetical protein